MISDPPNDRIQRVRCLLNATQRSPRFWLILFGLLMAMQISPFWYPQHDGSVYLSIGRSLATAETMTNFGSSRIHVAPGYPLLISPAFYFGDRPFLVLSLMQWLLSVIAMLGIYTWARRLFPSAAILITGLAMLNTELWINYRRTLKEMAFLAILIWVVNGMHALCQSRSARRTALLLVLTALSFVALVMIRYAGIVLAVGFGILMLWHAYQRRISWLRSVVLTLAVGVPASLAIIAHIGYERTMAHTHGGETYAETFQTALTSPAERLIEGLRIQVSGIGQVTIPCMFNAYARAGDWWNINNFVFGVWFLLLAVGWWRLVRHNPDVLALSLPFYIGLYSVWAYDQGARFSVTMVPVLMGCVWFGPGTLFGRHRENLTKVFLATHVLVACVYWIAIDAPRARASHQQWPTVEQIAELIQTNPGPVAMSEESRKSRLMLQLALDRNVRVWDRTRSVPEQANWLVLAENESAAPGFELYQVIDRFRVYRRASAESNLSIGNRVRMRNRRGDDRRADRMFAAPPAFRGTVRQADHSNDQFGLLMTDFGVN